MNPNVPVLAAIVLAPALVVALPCAASDTVPIARVTDLPRHVLDTRPEVAVRGIVIRTRPDKKDLILEDASGGIWVDVDKLAAGDGPPLDTTSIVPGMEIEVRGRVSAGGFSPPLAAATVHILGSPGLGAPRRVDPERLFCGAEDCRFVELTAVLQHPQDAGDRWKIVLESASRLLMAEIPKARIDVDPRTLVDAEVRIAGPTVSLFNTRGEFLRPWVFVDRAEWFTVVAPARPADGIPVVPLDTLDGFRTEPTGGHRVRTRGTVVHVVPGASIDLQEGSRGVRATLLPGETATADRFVPGDIVDVIGFPDRGEGVATLRHAVVRRLEAGEPPAPSDTTPAEILAANRTAVANSTMARPGDYEGCLVRFPARLVQRQPVAGGGMFILAALPRAHGGDGQPTDEPPVAADLEGATWEALAAVRPGSTLEVTGIARVEWEAAPAEWPPLVPRTLRLTIRDPADVRVLGEPPWWTPSRLLWALATTGAILAASLAWGATLRRRLATQTRLLAAEMRSRRDAAVEFDATLRERNRLAANLHDTLQQTIGGIAFQLDACEAVGGGTAADARRHFAVARQMVGHAAKELQESVWAMRSLPLEGKPFDEALAALLSRVGEGHDVAFTVRADDLAGVPEFVSGSLLMLVQEAVHNAIKHGAARRIEVSVGEEPGGRLRATVTDDGRGFEVGAQAGTAEGHFGIHGMRERAERLGGTLRITSRPGGGTVVEAVVQCRDYDADITSRR